MKFIYSSDRSGYPFREFPTDFPVHRGNARRTVKAIVVILFHIFLSAALAVTKRYPGNRGFEIGEISPMKFKSHTSLRCHAGWRRSVSKARTHSPRGIIRGDGAVRSLPDSWGRNTGNERQRERGTDSVRGRKRETDASTKFFRPASAAGSRLLLA